MQLNVSQREIALKVVFYGPPLSGKTTNLQALHHLLNGQSCGRLMTLDTADDRTLFFDVLPVFFKTSNGFKIKIKLYTVPGQIMHASTRRLVLEGADGIAFIADSQREEAKANNEFWLSLKENLRANKLDENIPIVIQFNKRDMPNVRSDEEIEEVRKKGKELVYGAVAIRGEGVLETVEGLLSQVWEYLDKKHHIEQMVKITREDFLRRVFEGASKPREGLLANP
ncbi:MAG: GTPase domain-containing protein [Deltaproteobacteria bacterium]|nr:GTPase domain-containing protein [Deltaproteobacteria bacterium]